MRRIAEVWQRLPIILRAVVVGSLVTNMGTIPWQVLSGANFKLLPSAPWSVPLMALYLWLYWQYLRGRGWPRTTAESRRRDLRARSLTGRVWRWSLLAGGLGWAALLALRIVFDMFFKLPPSPFPDVSTYPLFTVLSYVLMTSAVAGIAEEAGFRGYMQGPIERRHGPLVAILVVGTVFWLAHATHYIGQGWTFLGHMWFYLAAATVFGMLASLTASILPGVVLHAVADVLGFGLLWWWSSSPVTTGGGDQRDLGMWTTGLAGIVFALTSVWAYRRLAVVVHREARPGG